MNPTNKMNPYKQILLAVATTSALTLSSNAANVLVNGDFEAGVDPTNANWGNAATASNLPSWSFGSSVSVALNSGDGTLGFGNGGTNIVSSTGDVQLAFNDNTSGAPAAADVTVSQTFSTVPGTTYTVAFEMGGIFFAANPMEITASVFDGTATSGADLGQLVESRANTDGSGYNVPVSFTFTADTIQSTLVFVETSGNTNSSNPAIDNVSVNAVPEPSSAALLGLGGLALILRRRK